MLFNQFYKQWPLKKCVCVRACAFERDRYKWANQYTYEGNSQKESRSSKREKMRRESVNYLAPDAWNMSAHLFASKNSVVN